MLTYLLIAFVVVMAIVPLTHLAPSKGQLRVARMRELAATNGLFVEFRSLPAVLQRIGQSPRDLIYYGKRFPAGKADAVERGQWVRDGELWRSSDRRAAVPEVLNALPHSVIAASVDSQSCGIYWVESTHEDEAREVVNLVQQWCDSLPLR